MKNFFSFKNIRKNIDETLEVQSKKIKIIEKLKVSQESADGKQYEILSTRPKRLSSEEIALILEIKANSFKKTESNYQLLLIDHDSNFSKLKSNIKEKLIKREPFHYDIILKQYLINDSSCGSDEEGDEITGFVKQDHCNPVQINFDGNAAKLFYLESTMDDKEAQNAINIQRIALLIEFIKIKIGDSKVKLYGHASKKQHDAFSCPIFAIQDLKTMSHIGVQELIKYLPLVESTPPPIDFDMRRRYLPSQNKQQNKQLIVEDTPPSIDIYNLHPRFLKSTQNNQLVIENLNNEENRMISVCAKKEKMLPDYIQKYSIPVEMIDKKSGEKFIKKQNRAADFKMYNYLKKVSNLLDEMNKKSDRKEIFQEIINRRLGRLQSDCSAFASSDGISSMPSFPQSPDEKMNNIVGVKNNT